jgi:UPF0767 family
MWQFVLLGAKRYANFIVFPVALLVGTIGYKIERSIRENEEIVSRPSIQKERQDRLLGEIQTRSTTSGILDGGDLRETKKQLFHSVLDKNVKLSS